MAQGFIQSGIGLTLTTASTYQITTSVAINALNVNVSISSSWASQSISASIVNILTTASNANFYIPFVTTSSYQPIYIDPSSIYYNPGADILTVNNVSASTVTASLQGTSSWASNANTASFALNFNPSATASFANTASFALNFNPNATASFAITAGTASRITSDSNAFIQGGNSFGQSGSLGTNDNNALVLRANTTESLYVNASGRVSIGTASAERSLHVVGSGIISERAGSPQLVLRRTSPLLDWQFSVGAASLQILNLSASITTTPVSIENQAPGDSLIIKSSGNVGIGGINQPQTALHVSGTISSSNVIVSNQLQATGITGSLLGTASVALGIPANVYFNSVTSSVYAISQSIFTSQLNSYTISGSDDGRLVVVNSGSTINITVTTSSIPSAFSSMYYQSGSGRMTFVTASTSVVLRNRSGFSGSAGQYALVSLLRVPNGDFVLGGDLA